MVSANNQGNKMSTREDNLVISMNKLNIQVKADVITYEVKFAVINMLMLMDLSVNVDEFYPGLGQTKMIKVCVEDFQIGKAMESPT